jgi:NTE family protein
VLDLDLAHILLFDGLESELRDEIVRRMEHRRYAAGQVICRAGDPGSSLFVIQSGLAELVAQTPQGSRAIARLRRGDIVGEASLITGEPRSATVTAIFPTAAIELTSDALAQVLADYPALLINLTRIAVDSALSQRLARARALHGVSRRRGEAIALVFNARHASLVDSIVRASAAATTRGVALLDLTAGLSPQSGSVRPETPAAALAMLDDFLESSAAVITAVAPDSGALAVLFENMDRILFIGDFHEVETMAQGLNWGGEVALVASAATDPRVPEGMRVVRVISSAEPERDIAWLGRHLTRTKLGLALGAGGAKGFAHVGALKVIEDAGFVLDYVAGSSMGAVIGAWIAQDMSADEIEASMRESFTPETVQKLFKLTYGGMSDGGQELMRLTRETTRDRTFSELALPLVVMTVDLNARRPAPIMDGLVWEALVAACALPGMFPPYQRGEQRLVDGLALVPVPTEAVRHSGADIVIAVNLLNWDTLQNWPGELPPPPVATTGSKLLNTLLEVMDLAQYDNSIRHAAQADVVITPRFGPASWRDFHLADLFIAAGRAAAEGELAHLKSLACPNAFYYTQEERYVQ